MTAAKNNKQIQQPRGTRDILPEEWQRLDYIRTIVQEIATFYNFGRIETPMFEHTELFERGVGEETDVVEKEMYSFTTAGDTRLTLRPEATASVARAYIENGMVSWPQPVHLWYWGPMFRHERPQRGRYREFYQFGLEIIGDDDPVLDAEVIQVVLAIYEALGLEHLVVLVNSIGCQSCRPGYVSDLKDTFTAQKQQLCKDCRKRLDTNPLRVLDCKEEKCGRLANQAPQIVDHLCDECHDALAQVLEYLDAIDAPYRLDPQLVRGLDYYTKTVFEVVVQEPLGDNNDTMDADDDNGEDDDADAEEDTGDEEQDDSVIWDDEPQHIALGGGGRYDDLLATIGGDDTPAVGFAGGVERTLEEMERQDVLPALPLPPRTFLVQLGEEARKRGLQLLEELREKDISVAHSFSKGSIKSQLKIADKTGADAALILGKKEVMEDEIILRDMENGTQENVSMSRIITELGKILRRKPRAQKMRERGAMNRDDDSEEDDDEEQ